jgi:hypothetical protein
MKAEAPGANKKISQTNNKYVACAVALTIKLLFCTIAFKS